MTPEQNSELFADFIAGLSIDEGGLDFDPQDKGNWTGGIVGHGVNGGTNRGISTSAYPYIVAKMPIAERASFPQWVKDLTLPQTVRLYEIAYWNAVRASELPASLALVMADFGVNSGVSRSIKVLQACLHVLDDGDFGPLTMHAVNIKTETVAGLKNLIIEFQFSRLWFLMACDQWMHDGKGWSRRLVSLSVRAGNLLGT